MTSRLPDSGTAGAAAESALATPDIVPAPATNWPRLRILLGTSASGVLCSLAFAPLEFSYTIFAGIAGLILILRSPNVIAGSRKHVSLLGLVFGLSFMGSLLWWMNAVSPGAYIALTAAEAALFIPTTLALRMVLRLRLWPLWAVSVWVGSEFVRSKIPFGGFPWGRLAYAVADTPLGAYARLFGIPALSALVFLIAALTAAAVGAPLARRSFLAAVVAGFFAVGSVLQTGVAGPIGVKRVALVQGGVPVLFALWPPGEILTLHTAQTAKLAEAISSGTERQPDFVLWPENSTDIDPFEIPSVAQQIEQSSKQVNAPILVGAIVNGPTSRTSYNAGIVWDENGPGDRYRKQKVVPFGEYVPFRQALGALVPRFSREIPRDMLPGTSPGDINIAGVALGDTICWDIAYDDVVSRSIRSGAEALVVQTSNASFTQGQEAFLEGHIAAFDEIGGVPTRHIRYDNLTAAVATVIYGTGRHRTENERWVLFRSHYGFDAFYCQPGIEGAHEKGGIEGEVGRFRRTHLSPMPVADSLNELNERIRAWDLADEGRRIGDRIRSVGQDFTLERPKLASLPVERFDPGLSLTPRVDRSSLIRVRMARYSVPARFINRQVRVSLRASEVVVFDGRTVIARHPRVVTLHGQSVDLDHYLEVLKTKPGALPGSTALAKARAAGTFTTVHEAFWAAARKTDGDAAGTRELVDVLLLHRSMDAVDVIAGLEAALQVRAVTAGVVAVEARRHAAMSGASSDGLRVAQVSESERRVVGLTQRRLTDPAAVIAGLPADARPMPTVTGYDELLILSRRRRPEVPPATTEETA